MNDDLDPKLLAMFEAAAKEPLDDGFVDALLAQIDRERRRSMAVWVVVAALVAAVVATLVGPISSTIEMVGRLLPASLVEFETEWVRQLLSPVNSVAAVIAIGVLLIRRFWRGIFGAR